MNPDHISSAYAESVEKLVDLYVTEWDFSPTSTENQIRYHWEMDESEKKKALEYLAERYGR